MAINKNARLEFEAGQKPQGITLMTDSGDGKKFTTPLSPWSKKEGSEYEVTPDGVLTGGAIVPAISGANNLVDIAALSCYLAGVSTPVAAANDTAITRAVADVACINSVTVTSLGAIAVIKGTDSADASFSEIRGGAGGPPFIPVGSIEVGQVRVASNVAAAIAANEIHTVHGTHTERSTFPGWEENAANGSVIFDDTLPSIHTGSVRKGVAIDYSIPSYAPIPIAGDYKPSSNSHNVSSESFYDNKTVGSTTTTLGQGGFTAKLIDGITDAIVKLANENLWFRFFPNKNKPSHILDQGILGIDQDFSATDHPTANCTISAETEHVKVEQ